MSVTHKVPGLHDRVAMAYHALRARPIIANCDFEISAGIAITVRPGMQDILVSHCSFVGKGLSGWGVKP